MHILQFLVLVQYSSEVIGILFDASKLRDGLLDPILLDHFLYLHGFFIFGVIEEEGGGDADEEMVPLQVESTRHIDRADQTIVLLELAHGGTPHTDDFVLQLGIREPVEDLVDVLLMFGGVKIVFANESVPGLLHGCLDHGTELGIVHAFDDGGVALQAASIGEERVPRVESEEFAFDVGLEVV